METLVIFFVLIGLVSALVAQTICRAEVAYRFRASEMETFACSVAALVAQAELMESRLDNAMTAARAKAAEEKNAQLTEWNESAKHLLSVSGGRIGERIDVHIAVLDREKKGPFPTHLTYIDCKFKKTVEVRAEVAAYAMSYNMLAIQEYAWLRQTLELKFTEALAKHLADKIQLV